MTADEIVALGPLALGLLMMAAYGAWVFIHSDQKYFLRWALVPIAFVVAIASAKIYDGRLGYAAPGELPAKFVYLGHHVIVRSGHKAGLEVWAQAGRTRLYQIPYSRPMEDALERGRAAGKKGGTVVMQKARPGDKGGDEQDSPYESNLMLPSDIDPKEQPK